jgi:hypothetical protein
VIQTTRGSILGAKGSEPIGASRAELFVELDKQRLAGLPDQPYAFAGWKRCRIGPDYHVEIDRHWYSAPFQLIRQPVEHARRSNCRVLPQKLQDRQSRRRSLLLTITT